MFQCAICYPTNCFLYHVNVKCKGPIVLTPIGSLRCLRASLVIGLSVYYSLHHSIKNCSNKLFFNLEKASNYHKGHKASHRHYGEDNHDNTQASRRTTYRINMPMKVAKLILPQIRNKNQETIIRIYPDKRNEAQNQTGSNYLLSLSYKKLNDEGPQNQVFKDPCPGGCCCCPGSE